MATVVGETIRISGHLGGDEDLTVRGRVDGRIDLTRTIIVEPSGVIKAEVSVRNAIISGVVVGNLTASDSVELTADARVVGDLTAPRVIIVDGASFRGRVDMGDMEMARPAPAEAVARPSRTVSTVGTRPLSSARPAPTPSASRPSPTPTARPSPTPTARPSPTPTARPSPTPTARPTTSATTRVAATPPPAPPARSASTERAEVAATTQTKAAKAPAAPPRPPPPSTQKRKVKVKKRR